MTDEVDISEEAALIDARDRLCKWCKEGEPISKDEDGVNRHGRYHQVAKWGLGLRECRAVLQRAALAAAPLTDETREQSADEKQ